MKKYIPWILFLTCILTVVGCGNRFNDTATIGNVRVNTQSRDKTSELENMNSSVQIDTTTIDTTIADNIKQGFVGTIIEETTTYMIVEPDEDEDERNISERITITYLSDHYDYLYGQGRKVVIYYYEENVSYTSSDFEIITDDISTEGFREFELSVVPSEYKEKTLILSSQDIDSFDLFPDGNSANLYYYGISDVQISINNQTMTLIEAIQNGKITLNGIIAKANEHVKDGIIEEMSYDDGGSAVYQYQNYTIIKYHTLDGNRDVYIGSTDMNIDIAEQ